MFCENGYRKLALSFVLVSEIVWACMPYGIETMATRHMHSTRMPKTSYTGSSSQLVCLYDSAAKRRMTLISSHIRPYSPLLILSMDLPS